MGLRTGAPGAYLIFYHSFVYALRKPNNDTFFNLRQWLNISCYYNVTGARGQCLKFLFKKQLWKKIKDLITNKGEAVVPAILNIDIDAYRDAKLRISKGFWSTSNTTTTTTTTIRDGMA